ncbi:DNA alkylation repair protein [Microbacterium karelineae]|uniref:DNA alkylation repair protein n=1 Tax=Microbacterium karelineae TaxID=2654283 RepID=UPI0012EAB342|nr:DNA alkylation repair protein [Microbacterium karelineae]
MDAEPTTAADVIDALRAEADPDQAEKIRRRVREPEPVIGVRMGTLFGIAKQATDLPRAEILALIDDDAYEPRLTAFCILNFLARRRLSDEERTELAQLYLDHHDAITTWDMVDRAAPRVIGWPLMIGAFGGWDASRGELGIVAELAGSADPLRRRSAITAPLWFIRKGTDADVTQGLRVAEMLGDDADPYVRSAVKTYRKHAARWVG